MKVRRRARPGVRYSPTKEVDVSTVLPIPQTSGQSGTPRRRFQFPRAVNMSQRRLGPTHFWPLHGSRCVRWHESLDRDTESFLVFTGGWCSGLRSGGVTPHTAELLMLHHLDTNLLSLLTLGMSGPADVGILRVVSSTSGPFE
ncbi:hypothetical protein J6590_046079 [Homalodisca vitripennis]|nr:hypothetical protein J6590_046079 [Homalodisca vitripennis]